MIEDTNKRVCFSAVYMAYLQWVDYASDSDHIEIETCYSDYACEVPNGFNVLVNEIADIVLAYPKGTYGVTLCYISNDVVVSNKTYNVSVVGREALS